MIISHEYKFIFIHIVKTGGTSIEKVLSHYLDMSMNLEAIVSIIVEPILWMLVFHESMLA